MADFTIAVMEGDGIGPEIMGVGRKVLEKVARVFGHHFDYEPVFIGGCAIDREGVPITDETVEKILATDALFFSCVGGPKWESLPQDKKPEAGLLTIRKALSAYVNLRPIRIFPAMEQFSTLKADVIQGIDILIVRELVSGIYFGTPRGIEDHPDGERTGFNTMRYSSAEIRRISRMAFELARKRRKKVVSVDKANVLEVSALWRSAVEETHEEFPDVELRHMYVDNAAMQLIRDPSQFDVILAGNLFGDILSDEASMITGSLGMLPSASIGGPVGMFEPVHGSAPDIAGRGIANPIGQVATAAMMLRFGLDLSEEADAVERATRETLEAGFRTSDIYREGKILVDTEQMGKEISERIRPRSASSAG